MCAHGCPDGCFDPEPIPEDTRADWVVLDERDKS